MCVELEVVVKDKCILVGLYCINCGNKYFVAQNILGKNFGQEFRPNKFWSKTWVAEILLGSKQFEAKENSMTDKILAKKCME